MGGIKFASPFNGIQNLKVEGENPAAFLPGLPCTLECFVKLESGNLFFWLMKRINTSLTVTNTYIFHM
jgi:hypothetical protein